MKTIFKYELYTVPTHYTVPRGMRPLHVGYDPTGQACVWAEVDPDAEPAEVLFTTYGTGHPIDLLHTNYAGTYVEGPFVWHVYWSIVE